MNKWWKTRQIIIVISHYIPLNSTYNVCWFNNIRLEYAAKLQYVAKWSRLHADSQNSGSVWLPITLHSDATTTMCFHKLGDKIAASWVHTGSSFLVTDSRILIINSDGCTLNTLCHEKHALIATLSITPGCQVRDAMTVYPCVNPSHSLGANAHALCSQTATSSVGKKKSCVWSNSLLDLSGQLQVPCRCLFSWHPKQSTGSNSYNYTILQQRGFKIKFRI